MSLAIEGYRKSEAVEIRISGKYFPVQISGNKIETAGRYNWSKEKIFNRDFNSCQISRCRTMRGSQPHHIVSESLANNAKSRIEFGTYTGKQLLVYRYIEQELPKNKKSKFKEIISQRIIHNNNAITLCDNCHKKLHKGKLKLTRLEKPSVTIIRPMTFADENVMTFFKIMVEETLRDMNEVVNVNDIFRSYIPNLSQLNSYVYY